MSLPAAQRVALYESIAPHLDAIAQHFKNPKITVIVRAPDLADGDFVMSDDAPDAVIASLKKTWGRT